MSKETFGQFWANPWTRTVLPLVVIGAMSWGIFKNSFDRLVETVARNTTKTERTLDKISGELQLLKISQQKDDNFRESGEGFDATDAAKLELRVLREFRAEMKDVASEFASKIDSNNKETIRLIEKLDGKIDKLNEKIP